jgi:cobalt-zinc-cadmium efflux system membrane fusion protein
MTHAWKTFPWILVAVVLLAGCARDEDSGANEARAGATVETADENSGTFAATRLCDVHAAPASACFLCDPSLRDPGRLWCRGHNRYEDRCWSCHPELQDPDRLYCREHGLYEDECFYCHPELLRSSSERSPHRDTESAAALFCNEHGVPELECGICQPALADALNPGEGLKIRLLSSEGARKAGVTSEPLRGAATPETVSALGELRFNQNKLARITPQVGGVVRAVHVDLGDDVAAGEALVEISSSGIAEAKTAYLRAQAEETVAEEQLIREQSLHAQGVSSERELHEARARHTTALAGRRMAGQRLLDLGFLDRDIAEIQRSGSSGSQLLLRAPFGGMIIERQVVLGDVVAPGDRLLSVCDLGALWLDLAVPEAMVTRLRVGAPVAVSAAGLDQSFPGEVTWISDALDPTTRLGRVRADVPNPDRRLKAGMYVEAEVALGDVEAVAVDRDVVHRFGGNPFVFLELEPDLFEVRRVRLGGERNDALLVVAGLNPGDRVVVDRSYLVKSEFQKSRLGAGCVD